MSFFYFFLGLISAHADRAWLLDTKMLETPVTRNDPLRNLKYLWRDGARGAFFQVESPNPSNAGRFLAVEDWSPVRSRRVSSGIVFRDRRLLSAIQTTAAAGTTIVFQNRVPVGGFAVDTGLDFSIAQETIAPELAARPFVVLNGFSSLYSLRHEMVHHDDHESGLADEVVDAINEPFDDPVLTVEQLTHAAHYIFEGRAYHAELSQLLGTSDEREYHASIESDEHTRVGIVDGPDNRRYRFARAIFNFNRTHARRYLDLPEWIRREFVGLPEKYIPNFPRDYTPTGELNQARCERYLRG